MFKNLYFKSWLLLLCMIVGANAVWAQSDNSATYTSNVTLSTTGGTSASTAKVIVSGTTQYDALKAGTSKVAGAVKITVPSGTKYLHLHVAGWNNESVTVSVTPNTNISPKSISLTADAGISGNSPFTLGTPANATTNYYKVITFTNALTANTDFTFTATSGKRFVIWGVNAEEEAAPTLTHALIYSATNGSISGTDAGSNAVASGDDVEEGATVTLTATPADGYEFDRWSVSGTGSTLSNTSTNPTTFTMGTADATVTANFVVADPRTEAGLSYTNAEENILITAGTFKQTLNNPNELSVSYTSSDETVATVASDGTVTLKKAGVVTITASFAGNESYKPGNASYTLTVSKADAPISFSANTAEVGLDEIESFVAPTLSNEQGLTITYSSSDETVATVNSSTGVISFLKVGSTTITATSTENATYKSGFVSYTLTVTKAAENIPFAAAFSSTLGDFIVTADATLGNLWAIDGSSGAKASAYKNKTQNAGESWLISPYINITNAYAALSFDHADRYFNSESEMKNEATLWIREKGGDWEQLTIATYPSYTGTTESSFASTSNSLASYFGKKVQIGFKYLGNTTSAGSWWVKNFRVADDRVAAPISFADATVYKLLSEAGTFTGQALTNEEGLTVSYTSSNTDVATVEASTGVVTIKAVGETDITATYAETADYKANTATYKLVVTSKAAAGIEYAEATAMKKITLGTYTHELTNPNSLTVAYSSSNETVATVNASTGEVTMLKVGETTITATFTENEDYDGAVVSYTLTVIKDDPTLSFAKASVNAGLIDGTYQQVVTTTPADLPVTYSSSDETVATVAEDGTATLLKAGTTTITANYAGNDSYNSASATYTLTVVIDYASLPFAFDGGQNSIGTTLSDGTTGLMQSGLGSDYASKPYLKFDGTGDYVILKIAEAPGKLTYDIKGNSLSGSYKFTVLESANGTDYSTLKEYTSIGSSTISETLYPASTTRYIKWEYTTKASGNVALGNIGLQKAPPATPTFSVAEGEYDEAKEVTISCATDGATIYYTTNGDTPTSSSTEYTGAISITETTTLKAIAIKDEVESAVASATYTMNRPVAPEFDPEAFVFDAAFDVHLSTETDGATIYYTTDGSTPTNSSNVYTDKGISISTGSDVTVKAIAFKNGLTSDVASVTYTYDARVTPTFTLSTTELNLKVNETSTAVSLTTNSDGDVAFSCDDAHVTLTGTGNSRTISADAAGEYTVTVSVTNSETYKDAEGTITVNVTKKATTMAIATTFNDGKDLRYASEGLIEGTVKYNDAAIDPQPTVTYTSSDGKVATVDESGVITFKKVGATTITVSFEGNNEYEPCQETYDLVLYDTTPQETNVDITLNNSFFGCTSFTSWTTGMATSLSGTNKNVTVTYGKGTSSNMYCNTEKVRYYTNNTFTIDAPTGYHVITVDMNATISSATPSGTITTDTWEGDASSVSFTFANKTDLSSISVTIAPTVTLNKYGYATYCSTYPIDFSATEGFTAWRVSNVSENTITFEKITETIKEGQGVLLYNKDADGENKTTVTLAVGESAGATEFTTSENKLVGFTAPTEIDADTYYGLSSNMFKKVHAGTVPAGKALLPASVIPAGARELSFVFEEEGTVTAISDVRSEKDDVRDNIFDLQGRRVNKLSKGLFIKNGKKVVVK